MTDKEIIALVESKLPQELSLDEIAQVAGAPVSTISSRIHRGLAIMRSQLEGGAGAA